jgi:hypothetical protein|tara:strand:+ start:8 stop:712 length:705 start_codon:yes stop_codon:yes gene_type:complete
MSFGGGNSGGGTAVTKMDPYDPAKPALNQIISEAGNLYGQGVRAAGYVAPSQQTTQGLAAQELMGTAATQQLSDTLSGKYLNPFLSPMLQGAGNEIATAINTEFSGAGRTPGSPMNQQQIIAGVTDAALPMAFDAYERERQRQLGIASATPTLVQTGQQLENIERQRNLAPFAALQQYSGLVNPIATGLPVQSQQTNTEANPITTALGGALIGSKFGGVGAAIGGGLGFLGGLL